MSLRACLIVLFAAFASVVYAEPANSSCPDQAKSLSQLRRSFNTAKLPTPFEVTGTWVAIGIFDDARSQGKKFNAMDCNGIIRDEAGVFEEVMLIDGYTVAPHLFGSDSDKRDMMPDNNGSVTFLINFEGHVAPEYRCRMTPRQRLMCLGGGYRGYEFKRFASTADHVPPFVYVTGSVNKPGVYEFNEPFTAGEALKLAGGFRDPRMSMCLTVIRKDGNKPVRLKALLATPIRHDDTLDVQAVNDGQRLDMPCPQR